MADLDAIAAARLEAAQMEHARLMRERLAAAAVLRQATTTATQASLQILTALQEALNALAVLRGLHEHLEDGDWIKSPQAMAAERSGSTDGGGAR